MSPFSFLFNFALPSLSSVNAYLPALSLPENIQQRLVSFVLRRTLGRFVRHDGLLGDKVETQVATGRIAFGHLALDSDVRLVFLRVLAGLKADRTSYYVMTGY
jgi:autophagy-related protein 2